MKRLGIAANKFNYQELDRWVKEQFFHGINDDDMLKEINSEHTAIKNTGKGTNKQDLILARQVDAWTTQAVARCTSEVNEQVATM